MHNSVLRILRRFNNSKLFLSNQDLRPNAHDLRFSRPKVEVAMLDEERLCELEMTRQEINGLSWLQKAAPCFPIHGSKVKIIHEPSLFYATLLEKCKSAQRRITLASLYIGTGKLELDLIAALKESVQSSNGNVKVNILIDYMRGSRGKVSSRTMLLPLLEGKWKDSCRVYLYHTPKLRGILKALMPERLNELIGLQHMKLYIFDDTLIISGANLSNDYFTNRQDRYFLIEDCKDLCDFYNNLVERVGEFSFRLLSDGNTTFSPTLKSHPLKSSTKVFAEEAANKVRVLFSNEMEKRSEINKDEISNMDTWIFPLIQMGQLNIYHDSKVTLKVLQSAPEGGILRLATGYFNLTAEYKKALIHYCQATCHLLTAHPTANGFFNATGISGSIPAAYTQIEDNFCKMCENYQQDKRVTLWEFARPGWTYHAKGLWYSLPGQQKPCLTLIGSPNFGYRSVKRDLETQVVVVTKNPELQEDLQKEHERLFSNAKPVTRTVFSQQDRIPPAWISAIVVLFRYYF